MKEVIGVRFRPNGKIYYFDPVDYHVQVGTDVIVETARGVEYGKCVLGRKTIEDEKRISGLKPIIRLANDEDKKKFETNKKKSQEAFQTCVKKINEHGLKMKLISAEYTFDGSKVLFYFTADGRIDFRELVKDLAAVFRKRIELRQIGVRDETKIRGGYGICGRPLCCSTFLKDFAPVSIKMAKEQSISLNPTKISGVCGRLMCCLKNEQETYEYLESKMPAIGDKVTTLDGLQGEVQNTNVLRQTAKLIVEINEEKELREYKVSELKFKKKRKQKQKESEEDLKELKKLEALERKEGNSKIND